MTDARNSPSEVEILQYLIEEELNAQIGYYRSPISHEHVRRVASGLARQIANNYVFTHSPRQ